MLPNSGNRHPLRKKVVQRWWHFLSKIVCRDITEDLKAVLILLFCRWKVFMQIRRSPEQRNIFWSGLGKQLKKLRGKILWLQNSSTPLLVSYLIYWIYAFIVWREFSCRKMKSIGWCLWLISVRSSEAVKDFGSSWKNGLAFLHIIHAFRWATSLTTVNSSINTFHWQIHSLDRNWLMKGMPQGRRGGW